MLTVQHAKWWLVPAHLNKALHSEITFYTIATCTVYSVSIMPTLYDIVYNMMYVYL